MGWGVVERHLAMAWPTKKTHFDASKPIIEGQGGGQMVGLLAFHPTIRVRILLSLQFLFGKLFEKNENKRKRGREWLTSKTLIKSEFYDVIRNLALWSAKTTDQIGLFWNIPIAGIGLFWNVSVTKFHTKSCPKFLKRLGNFKNINFTNLTIFRQLLEKWATLPQHFVTLAATTISTLLLV